MSKHPGDFVAAAAAAAEFECLPVEGLTLSTVQLYTVSMRSQVKGRRLRNCMKAVAFNPIDSDAVKLVFSC